MHHFIVIGNPINHSKSPQIHHAFAQSVGMDISYQRQFCPDESCFEYVLQAFFNGGGVGANVTLPFKQTAYELCQAHGTLSNHAHAAKAVNTLAIKDGKYFGDNTDGRGLVADLLAQNLKLSGSRVGIIGAGGATRGVILPLIEQGADLTIFNRTLTKAEQLLDDFRPLIDEPTRLTAYSLDALGEGAFGFDVIINATSATTHGQALAISPDVRAGFAYDMMYGKPSAFLEHFAHQGAGISDGFGMLIHQAMLSFELWTGESVPSQTLDALRRQLNVPSA